MGRNKLSEEEKEKSKLKRQEYLKQWRQQHSMDYYNNNKEKILKRQRQKRELQKGAPLNEWHKVGLKDMTKEELSVYHRLRVKRYRQKIKNKDYQKLYIKIKKRLLEFIKEELPDDEIMLCCENVDVNGIRLRKKLEQIMKEE